MSRPVAADRSVLPPPGALYTQILRGADYAWWRSLLGALFGLSLFVLLTQAISQLVITFSYAIVRPQLSFGAFATSAVAFRRPSGMLAANIGIAFLIPISFLLMAMLHRVRPRWLSSVQPRMRWRYLLFCAGIAVVALNGVLILSNVVTGTATRFSPQPGFWSFLIVILLTSPLQAAAEEIFFRGYLLQALASLFVRPWFGIITSSLIFAFFHGGQNVPLFLDRLAFGLLAALLVLKTGGLEAGISAHVVNNIFAYVIAGLTSSIATVRALQEISWTNAVFDVGGFAIFAALAWLLARRLRLRTVVGNPPEA